MAKIKIRDLPDGVIVWHNEEVLGVKGLTLDYDYYESYVVKVEGNVFDYELVKIVGVKNNEKN